MPTLDVTDVIAIEIVTEVTLTAPDNNTFLAKVDKRYIVPVNQNSMTTSTTDPINCMTIDGSKRTPDNVLLQGFCVNEVRTPA